MLDSARRRQRQLRLLDLYGSLLTDHQRRILHFAWELDWSYGEIAQREGVTRTAVYDVVRRTTSASSDWSGPNVFESLTERLDQALKTLTGRGKLSEADVDAGLREVRLALLEADVNYKVVKDFVASIRARAVGAEVMDSLNPGQQLV